VSATTKSRDRERASEPERPPTKERILYATAELFRRQGYTGTGMKQIAAEAEAPFGSLYHFFPGGKEQLGAEAVRVSGAIYAQLIPAVLDPAPEIVAGVRNFFAGAAAHLVETDYADACPIATVALEVSSSSEAMREACAEVFESWIVAGAERFVRAGIDPDRARQLTIAMLAALEGAFVLARASRSTEPLKVAGELSARAVEAALGDGPAEGMELAPRPERVRRPERASQPQPRSQPQPPPRPEPPPTAARVRPRLRARWPDRGDARFPGPASP
jgi:AcrR family transcriptional regulator